MWVWFDGVCGSCVDLSLQKPPNRIDRPQKEKKDEGGLLLSVCLHVPAPRVPRAPCLRDRLSTLTRTLTPMIQSTAVTAAPRTAGATKLQAVLSPRQREERELEEQDTQRAFEKIAEKFAEKVVEVSRC